MANLHVDHSNHHQLLNTHTIREILEYIHDDLRFIITKGGFADSTEEVPQKLSIRAILDARMMEYFKDVLWSRSFREKLWPIVSRNIAYDDIVLWLRANRCPYIYDAKTVKTANEYGIYRFKSSLFNGEWDYTYEGEFKDGKHHGRGKLTKFGNVYEGEFVDGNKHRGKEVFANGDVYEGYFNNGNLYHGKYKQAEANGDFLEGRFIYGMTYITKAIYVRANGYIYDVCEGEDGKLILIRKASIIDVMAAVPLALCMASLTSIGYFWDHKLRLLYPGVRPPVITRRKVGWEPESLHKIGALTVAIKRIKVGWVHESLFAIGALTVGCLSKKRSLESICALSAGALSIWGISEVLVLAGHLSVTVAVKRVYATFFLKK